MSIKYDRPEVKQITKQWVRENSTNITERDIGLLQVLYKHKLLRRDQLQRLYPKFPSTDYLNKRLKILYNSHFIDRVYPPVKLGNGSSKQHVCLDRAGIILLGKENYTKPIKVVNGLKSLPLGWEHTVMLNEYECMIRDYFKSIGGSVIALWQEEPNAYGDTRIIPDVTLVAKYNNTGYVFFIEIDLGTEDVPYIKKKLDSYKDYYMSKNWIHTEWASKFRTPFFPRVLFMTENGRTKRMETLRDHVKESSIKFVIGDHQHFVEYTNKIVKGDL